MAEAGDISYVDLTAPSLTQPNPKEKTSCNWLVGRTTLLKGRLIPVLHSARPGLSTSHFKYNYYVPTKIEARRIKPYCEFCFLHQYETFLKVSDERFSAMEFYLRSIL